MTGSGTPSVVVGELRAVALPGDPAPPSLGGTYRRVLTGPDSVSIDDAGCVALAVELSDGSAALVLHPADGEPAVVARSGEGAPGGGRYARFGPLDLADGGQVLFVATLDDTTQGLFLRGRDGSVERVAGSGRYTSFERPTIVTAGMAAVSFAFLGRLPCGTVELEQHPGYERPRVTLCTGATLPDGAVVESLAISRLGMAVCAVAGTAGGGSRAVVVVPSTVSTGEWTSTGAVLPGHGVVQRLLTPPTVCAQLGFVTLVLDGGRTAVCSRPPAVLDPEVVLATGDAAPGMDGVTVRSVGPPVASSSSALQTPFGLAVPVTLSDGRAALWTAVFAGQAPLAGAAILPWVAGDHADHPVDSLTPVKLGNDGTLLATAAGGLHTFPNLFSWFT